MLDEYRMEMILEDARTDKDFRTDEEILAEEMRTCGHMSDFAYSLLMQKEDDWMRTWGRIYG